jgi:hypothetical protein
MGSVAFLRGKLSMCGGCAIFPGAGQCGLSVALFREHGALTPPGLPCASLQVISTLGQSSPTLQLRLLSVSPCARAGNNKVSTKDA